MSIDIWWAGSKDDEKWQNAASVEEALVEAQDQGCEVIYVSRRTDELHPAQFVDSREFFERLDEEPENGPYDEGWDSFLGIKPEHYDELDDLWKTTLRDWYQRNRFPSYSVINTDNLERIEVPKSEGNPPPTN